MNSSEYETYCKKVCVLAREFCFERNIRIFCDEGESVITQSPMWDCWGTLEEETEFWFIKENGETTQIDQHEDGQELLELISELIL